MDAGGPQCQVCLRTPDISLPFYCQTCARSVLYESRIRHAQALLEKENFVREIESAVQVGSRNASGVRSKSISGRDPRRPANRLMLEQTGSATSESRTKVAAVQEESQIIQAKIEKMRETLLRRKEDVARRSSNLQEAQRAFRQDQIKSEEGLQREVASVQSSWDRLHDRTAEARVFLCREAAALYGLSQRKKRKGMPGRDVYLIGGVPIIDLRDLNNADPEQVTTAISRVAHLLHLTSHYLGLRLPAEISLATAFQPYCSIHTPLSSYKTAFLPPGLRHQSSTGSAAPRQRILQLERPLHHLASEEPITYSLFVDAITLLAWDVAWVAKTQGLEVGAKSWEEICAIGKNMWSLFVAPPRPPTLRKRSAAVNTSTGLAPSPTQSTSSPLKGQADLPPQATAPIPDPGRYSHSSSHSFLSSSGPDGGADHLRGWRFANPVRIIDRIKAALLNERTGAEWEVLEKPESEDAEEENVLHVDPTRPSVKPVPKLETLKEDQVSEGGSGQTKAKQGWTKLRNPNAES